MTDLNSPVPTALDRSGELYGAMREQGYATLSLGENEFVFSTAAPRRKLYGPATITVFVESDESVSLEYRIMNGKVPEQRVSDGET